MNLLPIVMTYYEIKRLDAGKKLAILMIAAAPMYFYNVIFLLEKLGAMW